MASNSQIPLSSLNCLCRAPKEEISLSSQIDSSLVIGHEAVNP